VSGEYVERLKRRARAFLSEAEEARDPDLAVFFAEQSMQLYVKAVCYELFGVAPRGRRLRELVGLLARSLAAHGYVEQADRLARFVDRNRRLLILAEEAYAASRYGDVDYTPQDALQLARLARALMGVLEEARRGVELG